MVDELPQEQGNPGAGPFERQYQVSDGQGMANLAGFLAGAGAGARLGWRSGHPAWMVGLPVIGGATGLAGVNGVGSVLWPEHHGHEVWAPEDRHERYRPTPPPPPQIVGGMPVDNADAREIDRQIESHRWMADNPTASGAMATGMGLADALLLGTAGDLSDGISHPFNRSAMRSTHPYTYRGGQAAGVAGVMYLSPQMGLLSGLKSVASDPWFWAQLELESSPPRKAPQVEFPDSSIAGFRGP